MFEFSPKLIERCKSHYAQKYHVELTSEQTEVFLRSLGNLYLIVAGLQPNPRADEPEAELPRGRRAALAPAATGRPPVILDSLHTQSDENYKTKNV